jgi:hypothetical protein
MRFMMLLKADKRTEAGELPSRHDLETMGKYNQQLIDAGMMLDGVGLQPTSKGARIIFANGTTQVTDGPFAETKEIVAGYWMIKANSLAEAIAWAKKAPFNQLPHEGRSAEIEIRQVYELEDFAEVPDSVAQQQASFDRK